MFEFSVLRDNVYLRTILTRFKKKKKRHNYIVIYLKILLGGQFKIIEFLQFNHFYS